MEGDVRQEIEASVEARRELGPEYEEHVVDALVAKIEKRLAPQEPAPLPRHHTGPITPLVLGSLAVSIPLLAIAGNFAGLAGIIAVCVAIVLVNLVVARR